jgi:hypothetical protein
MEMTKQLPFAACAAQAMCQKGRAVEVWHAEPVFARVPPAQLFFSALGPCWSAVPLQRLHGLRFIRFIQWERCWRLASHHTAELSHVEMAVQGAGVRRLLLECRYRQ